MIPRGAKAYLQARGDGLVHQRDDFDVIVG